MKSNYLSLSLLALFTAACAGSADRAPAQRNDEDSGMAGATPGARERPDSGVPASDAAKSEAGQAQAGTGRTGAPPALMIIGVYVESPLAAACGITLPPAAFFEFDSANLDVSSNESLRQVATCLTTGPLAGRKVELVGRTDPRGDDEYNRQLGRSRAESVEDYLQKRGVARDNIVTRSTGEQRAEGDPPGEWPLDRRVDIRLLPK